MRCPNCDRLPTSVLKTEMPIDEGMDNVKRRRRVCRNCRKYFQTFEVTEAEFRKLCPKPEVKDQDKESDAVRSPLRTKKRNESEKE